VFLFKVATKAVIAVLTFIGGGLMAVLGMGNFNEETRKKIFKDIEDNGYSVGLFLKET